MSTKVTRLTPREHICLDPARIESLHAQWGGDEVQAMVDRAMDELCGLRDELAQHYHAQQLADFHRALRRLGRICDHLGLVLVSQIASDVAGCLTRGDATATAATWARLRRNIDGALDGRWTLPA